jgi:hypothetical protein
MARSPSIDLSTIYCSKEQLNSKMRIHIEECSTYCVTPIPGYIQGFYGFQGKHGLSIAGKAAINRGENPIAVLMQTKLAAPPLRTNATLESIKENEFVNLMRSSRELNNYLADFWYTQFEIDGKSKEELSKIDWSYPSRFMRGAEHYIPRLLAHPDWKNIKIFVYPAEPTVKVQGVELLTVGLIKKENIGKAFLMYSPDTPVSID